MIFGGVEAGKWQRISGWWLPRWLPFSSLLHIAVPETEIGVAGHA